VTSAAAQADGRTGDSIARYSILCCRALKTDFGHSISLDGMSSIFHLINRKKIFIFNSFGRCLLPKNISDSPNNIAIPDSAKVHPARTPMLVLRQLWH